MKSSIRAVWFFCIITLLPAPIFFAGCVPRLTIAGSGVYTTQEAQMMGGCKSLGQIEATANMPTDMAYYAVLNKLKNQTGAMGGNWLLIKEYIPESRDGAKMVGEAYYCLDKIPTY